MTQHDQQLPDRGGDILDDIRAALARRNDLSDEHRAFYAEVVGRFEALAVDRDAAQARADRLWLAWQNAARRAYRWRFRAEARVAARDRMRRQLDRAIEERDAALTDAATVRQAVAAALETHTGGTA